MKQLPNQWLEASGSMPKKAKSNLSAARVFWDSKEILFTEYIAQECYSFITKFAWRTIEVSLARTAHQCRRVSWRWENCGIWEALARHIFLIWHPLDASFCFRALERNVFGKSFASNKEVEKIVNEYYIEGNAYVGEKLDQDDCSQGRFLIGNRSHSLPSRIFHLVNAFVQPPAFCSAS